MATKPSAAPRWAETAGGTPATNIATPTSGEADSGYVAGQTVVSSSKLNYLLHLLYLWALYVKDAVFVADSGSAAPGVTATGDGAAPGAQFTPGGGGAPARGSLALPPQPAPTAPSNGDVWTTAAALFARINGATRTQAALEKAQTFTQPQAFTGSAANGAVNLVPQTAPSAPTDGDLWTTIAGFFARIAGSSFTVALLEAAQTFTGSVLFTGTATFTPTALASNAITATGKSVGAGVIGIGGTSVSSIGVSGVSGNIDGIGLRAGAFGSTPSRGSLNLGSQTAPTNPQPGDIWFDGTNIKGCKVAGTAVTII